MAAFTSQTSRQTGSVTSPQLAAAVNRYAAALHTTAGSDHHVASPLGAWMLAALFGPLVATDPSRRRDLGDRLGVDPPEAASLAGALLRNPHPMVSVGAGLWIRSRYDNQRTSRWRQALPEGVASGDVPSQEKLDEWAADKTSGLIDRFPLRVTPEVAGVVAGVLATKVSWEVPFSVVTGDRLGTGEWAAKLSRVLETPADPRHRQFITETATTGPLAVHLSPAQGGLLVGSVIAADPSVPASQVLAQAEHIVTSEAQEPGLVARRSLFDLPLGESPGWTIAEEPGPGRSPVEPVERFTSYVPAWSAETKMDLAAGDLGFGAVAEAIAADLALPEWRNEATQTARARYGAVGFEAAAVSGLAVTTIAHVRPIATPRRALIRFNHPYAVVAVACDDPRQPSPPHWLGVPVFSAWVAEPDDAVESPRP